MKLLIAGIRYSDPQARIIFDDFSDIVTAFQRSGVEVNSVTHVISGNAIGVDRLGERWADIWCKPLIEMPVTPAEWNRLGKRAGPMRNKRMAEVCDFAIIVWDGESRGTKNMIAELIKLQKPHYVHIILSNRNLEELCYE